LRPAELLAVVGCNEIPDRWAELYVLLAYTYLRPNELAALQWKDVDFEMGLIDVTKAWDFDAGEVKPYPKTAAGVRKVPIEPTLAPVLKVLAKGKKATAAVVDMPPKEDWAATLREHLRRAGVNRPALFENSATVKHVRLYDLRATGITWRTIRGDDARVIQRHAGHEKYSTTEGYVREAEDYRGKLGEVFPPVLEVLTARAPAASNRSEGENH
jgi:integrase